MVTWCNQLRETYRRVQRALARTGVSKRDAGIQTDETRGVWSEVKLNTSQPHSGSEPHGEPAENPLNPFEEDVSPREAGEMRSEHASRISHAEEEQSQEDWDWWSQSGWWSHWAGYKKWWDDSSWKSERAPEPSHSWEDESTLLPEILPQEVLGWILMRRSGLPSSSRLSIQASAGNSLRLDDIERAMRQQEDELLQIERSRQQGSPKHRTFWVEKDESWGILLAEPDDLDTVTDDQIHWLSQEEAQAMLAVPEDLTSETEQAWYNDGWNDWSYHDGEWYTQGGDGWISYADLKPWYDIEEAMSVDPAAGKELQDIYANYDQKVRTFREAREAVHQKGKSRGFFQPSSKGKSKGTPKGKSTKGSVFGLGFQGKGNQGIPVVSFVEIRVMIIGHAPKEDNMGQIRVLLLGMDMLILCSWLKETMIPCMMKMFPKRSPLKTIKE